MTQEQLYQQQQAQKQLGDRGEDFVLRYERQRLAAHPQVSSVRLIGRSDVGMGYDILSFHGITSQHHDRYIEVKTYSGTPHFILSPGEQAAAEKYATDYYLYLVDANKITTPGYAPIIIQNPVRSLSESQWTELTKSKEYIFTEETTLPADIDTSTVLVGCYRSNEHLVWIRQCHSYNVRQGSYTGHVGSDDVTTTVRYLLLYDSKAPLTYRLYGIDNYKVVSRNEMLRLCYPDPHAPQYILYHINRLIGTPPLDIKQLLRTNNDKLQRTSGTPIFISGRQLRQYLLTGPVQAGTTVQRVYSNDGKPWSAAQTAKLQALYTTGTTIAQLAHEFRRSAAEVRAQLQSLGILRDD